jgi:hypothetical protein
MGFERIDQEKDKDKFIKLLKWENFFLTIALIGAFLACFCFFVTLCVMNFEYHSKTTADLTFHGKNCKAGPLNISSVDVTIIGLTEEDKNSIMQDFYRSAPDICESVSAEITVYAPGRKFR